MKKWSANPVNGKFKIKLFLDTNILVFITDKTYPIFNKIINLASASHFIDLVSSQYVLFEFIGVRKREHYLRKVIEQSKITHPGEVNYSSLFKASQMNSFTAPEIEFDSIVNEIKKSVEEEIDELIKMNIDFDYSHLHIEQIKPVIEICLSSKISNQDSMVLISSVLPSYKQSFDNVILFTKDKEFFESFNESIISIMQKHDIYKPKVAHLFNHKELNKFNSCDSKDDHLIKKYFNEFILNQIQEKNNASFLGISFVPHNPSFPKDVICFKLNKNVSLPSNIYLLILDPELDFVYNTNNKIESFYHNGKPLENGYASEMGAYVSFKLENLDKEEQDLFESLKKEGNLIFIHPDN